MSSNILNTPAKVPVKTVLTEGANTKIHVNNNRLRKKRSSDTLNVHEVTESKNQGESSNTKRTKANDEPQYVSVDVVVDHVEYKGRQVAKKGLKHIRYAMIKFLTHCEEEVQYNGKMTKVKDIYAETRYNDAEAIQFMRSCSDDIVLTVNGEECFAPLRSLFGFTLLLLGTNRTS